MSTSDVFWVISRGAGTTALVLSSAAVAYGLAMAGPVGSGNASDRRSYHEILSLSVMVALVVHAVSLLGDAIVHPSVVDIAVPFVWSLNGIPLALGIVSAWALICLGLSFYVRDRIGRKRWRTIHMFTLLAWAGGVVHTLVEGSDAGEVWFLALVVMSVAPVLVMLALRIVSAQRSRPRRLRYSRATA